MRRMRTYTHENREPATTRRVRTHVQENDGVVSAFGIGIGIGVAVAIAFRVCGKA